MIKIFPEIDFSAQCPSDRANLDVTSVIIPGMRCLARLGNTVQDFLFPEICQDNRDALLYYRMLYGNELLLNLQPSTVTDIVASIICYAYRNSEWFKVGEQSIDQEILQLIRQETVFKQAKTYLQSPAREPFFKRKTKRILEMLLTLLD